VVFVDSVRRGYNTDDGAFSFELFTGVAPDTERMLRRFRPDAMQIGATLRPAQQLRLIADAGARRRETFALSPCRPR
jgi:hypothetical protein